MLREKVYKDIVNSIRRVQGSMLRGAGLNPEKYVEAYRKVRELHAYKKAWVRNYGYWEAGLVY